MSLGQKLRLITAGLGVLLMLIIALQNLDSVSMRILFLKATMPIWALILLCLLAGYGLGVISAFLFRRRRGT